MELQTIKYEESKYFTERGIKALETRLKNFVIFYNEEEKYPFQKLLYSFPRLSIESKSELFGRIRELSQLLNKKVKIIKMSNGKEKIEVSG